jgi:DNA polymerase III epsilon subunit-like protein
VKYVIVDLHTGGFDSKTHSLLSVAMIKTTANFQRLDDLYIRIRHETFHVTSGSLENTGMDLRRSGTWSDAATARKQILEFLDAPEDVETSTTLKPGYVAIGTNIGFDIMFLKQFLGERTVNNLISHRFEEVTSNFRDLQKTGVIGSVNGYMLWQMLEALGIKVDSTATRTALENAELALQASVEMHRRTLLLADALKLYVKRYGGNLKPILKCYREKNPMTKLKGLRR